MSAGSISLDILLNQISADAISGSEDAIKDIKKRYPALSEKEARERTLQMLEIYRELVENLLAIPTIQGRKTESDKYS